MTMKKQNLGLLALVLLAVACGGAPGNPDGNEPVLRDGEGAIQLPLLTTGANGQGYRLTGGIFEITGPVNRILMDTSEDTLTVQLPAGGYTLELTGNYQVERVVPNEPPQPIQATLVSPNPMAFTVAEGEARTVRFIFKTPAPGTTDLGFTVDTGGWVTGTLDFVTFTGAGPSPFQDLIGKSAPFTLSFETAVLSRSTGFPPRLNIEGSPVLVQFGGPYSAFLNESLAPNLSGGLVRMSLMNNGPSSVRMDLLDINNAFGPPHLFSLMIGPNTAFPGLLDKDGVPLPQPFQIDAPFNITSASGPLMQVSGRMRATGSPR
ncbi:hypothetical protein NVS55_19320 [Myxococcus stipitatus]|uniref:hypothetical protein n=1 Tax=Myxococcus stipitatus TaxID=83455 RepID=UPI003144FCA1